MTKLCGSQPFDIAMGLDGRDRAVSIRRHAKYDAGVKRYEYPIG